MKPETIIRLLTTCSLAGLLFGVGLRLTLGKVLIALRQCRLASIIAVNFILVPALAVLVVRAFNLGPELSIGIILLAAAPFAPVVPVFARMARADLALAAGLTTLFPILSALLTPLVVALALRAVPGARAAQFDTVEIVLTLLGIIVIPLSAGLVVNHLLTALGRWLLRPVEILSEAAGAISLAYVTFVEGPAILATGWIPLFAMALLFEFSLLLGLALGGPERNARRVVALGTSNRNIALALLLSLESFSGTAVVPSVVANGLLLILLGLLHVACWRFGLNRFSAA